MSSFRRITILLTLGLALLAPWAATAQPRGAGLPSLDRSSAPAPADLFAKAWSTLSRLWAMRGCYIDPNGVCPPPASAPAKSLTQPGGCGLDPSGHPITVC